MTIRRFSTLLCQLTWLVTFASLSVWSNSTFATCKDTVPNGVAACYPINGDAKDYSGNANNASLRGGVTLTTDRFGNVNSAYHLNGVDGFIEAPDSPSLDVGTGDYSISIWVRYEGNGSVDRYNVKAVLVDKRDYVPTTSSTARGYSLYLYPTQLGTQMADNTKYNNFNANAVLENNGKWHHLVAVIERKNTSGLKLYMDSILIGTFNPTSFSISLDSGSTFKIGHTTYPNQVFVNASVDDVRLYKRAISETEVKQLYNEPSSDSAVCNPATYNGNTGTLQIPSVVVEGISDVYKTTMQQFSNFAFRVTQNAITSTSNKCPATYSPTTGILHIPMVVTPAAYPLNTKQCYDVTLQAFSSRFQLNLDTLKVVNCP